MECVATNSLARGKVDDWNSKFLEVDKKTEGGASTYQAKKSESSRTDGSEASYAPTISTTRLLDRLEHSEGTDSSSDESPKPKIRMF